VISDLTRAWSTRTAALAVGALLILGAGVLSFAWRGGHEDEPSTPVEMSSQSKRPNIYRPSDAQCATLAVEPVQKKLFRTEHATEGKISIDEDRATPIFSPYPGRVTRLMAKPGDQVQRDQPLFMIEANDMVQAQNDFLAAVANINKANSRVNLGEIVERQTRTLHESRAGSLRDFQQAQSDLVQARGDLRTAEALLEAARNRLVILGKTDAEIEAFRNSGKISPETPIHAPISGTVVGRKVGPGQFVSYTSIGSIEPVFTIGDLSTVWLVAYIRESDAAKVRVGQELEFTVLSHPGRTFKAEITYVSAGLDPATRRLMVRATIDNAQRLFKPEMFANIVIFTDEGMTGPAVARDAVIVEADGARVWVARDDMTAELRKVQTGMVSGGMIQILQGLQPGEKVITKGGIFVDRAAGS